MTNMLAANDTGFIRPAPPVASPIASLKVAS
jgi:hypothetical protein